MQSYPYALLIFCFSFFLFASCSDDGAISVSLPPDSNRPVIVLNGAASIRIVQGGSYTELGATATDDIDGALAVVISGSVDTATVATYLITYSATDTAGNVGNATRSVEVDLQQAFITTWKTDNAGTSFSNQVKIGTNGGGYSYNVDWGDGQTNTNLTTSTTHTYAIAGTYTVSITGDFPQIYFYTTHDNDKLLSIEQWGDIEWQSMYQAFYNCSNVVGNAIDVPDLSQVITMRSMFDGATVFNQDIGNWDVSSVESTQGMFSDAASFNQDISNWDMSSIVNMASMFYNASAFNQDISVWAVSAVASMYGMFQGATSFNQNIGDWDVSYVNDMTYMFEGASSFNQDIGAWDVSNAVDMSGLFQNATAFDQDISTWNVTSVINMTDMFNNVTLSTVNYDALLLGWSVRSLQSNVTFSAGNSIYTDQPSRDVLTGTYLWTVTDGGT